LGLFFFFFFFSFFRNRRSISVAIVSFPPQPTVVLSFHSRLFVVCWSEFSLTRLRRSAKFDHLAACRLKTLYIPVEDVSFFLCLTHNKRRGPFYPTSRLACQFLYLTACVCVRQH
jgi:hypothetical protein